MAKRIPLPLRYRRDFCRIVGGDPDAGDYFVVAEVSNEDYAAEIIKAVHQMHGIEKDPDLPLLRKETKADENHK